MKRKDNVKWGSAGTVGARGVIRQERHGYNTLCPDGVIGGGEHMPDATGSVRHMRQPGVGMFI